MLEGQTAVAKKIAYLETLQKLADTCTTANEFMSAVEKAFPDYQGKNYLHHISRIEFLNLLGISLLVMIESMYRRWYFVFSIW